MPDPAGEGARTGGPTGRVAIIVQARMGSTRLPGKVLAPVLGRPLLAWQLERLARVRTPATLVVATTEAAPDDKVAMLAIRLGARVFRGSEEDVLERMAGAAASVEADVVVRTTADCPLIDPAVVDQVIERLLGSDCDYASNTLTRTYPRGLDVEAMTREALDAAAREAVEPAEREHVTPFIYRRPDRFRLCDVVTAPDRSSERWTVDTADDLELVTRVLGALGFDAGTAGYEQIVRLLDDHPEWRSINAHVEQKAT